MLLCKCVARYLVQDLNKGANGEQSFENVLSYLAFYDGAYLVRASKSNGCSS